LEFSGLPTYLADAELVVVGEGSLDSQTLRGKGPATLAALAERTAERVIAVSGRCTLDERQLRATGIDAAYALTDIEPDLQVCLSDARRLLELTAERMAHDWLSRSAAGVPAGVTVRAGSLPGRSDGRSR
jgi:glycerate kinase